MVQRFVLLFVLATMPVLFGAVQAWVWSVYTVVMYAAFLVMLWSGWRAAWLPKINGWWMAVGLFLAAALVGVFPLPHGLLSQLSPVRFALLNQVESLAGEAPVFWTVSYTPLLSLAWWAFLLGLALLFRVMCAQFASSGFLRVTMWVLFGLAVLEAFYGILQALLPNMGVLWVSYLKASMGNARGSFINRNHFAGFMEMLLPLMLGFSLSRVAWSGEPKLKKLLQSERLHQHMLVILGLVVMALALLFSQSRGGITGGLIGLGVFLLLVRNHKHRMPLGAKVMVGIFLGLTLFYGLRIGFGPIIERFLALEQGNSRMDIWRDGLVMIGDHPAGIGLAAFKSVFPVYNVMATTDATMPYYMHNDWLQLLAETGWVGFISLGGAFLAFMGVSLVRIRRMASTADPQRFFLAVGAFSGLVALGFHSLMDFNLQIPSNAVFFVMLLAMARVLTMSGNR